MANRSRDALHDALYGRLRALAACRLCHENNVPTLTPTALMHEAYRDAGKRAGYRRA